MNSNKDNKPLILDQFVELKEKYKELNLCEDFPGRWVIRGNLSFIAKHQSITIKDSFDVLIKLPKDYPESPPTVKETGGRIPWEFHTYREGILCLGAPFEVREKFYRNPRLLKFVDEQVVPFLFAFCYRGMHKDESMPWGELPHGWLTILEYYRLRFNVTTVSQTLGLLKILADDNYKGHFPCPCDSGHILRKCHGETLRYMKSVQSSELFLWELYNILARLPKDEKEKLTSNEIPRAILKELEKRFRKETHMDGSKYI